MSPYLKTVYHQPEEIRIGLAYFCIGKSTYNAHGHKLRSPVSEKAQFVTALGIAMHSEVEIHSEVMEVETIAIGHSIRELDRL
jgi:hypothetical protein